jgi:DNA-directed RNA polymerase specialized sigma24 family protein
VSAGEDWFGRLYAGGYRELLLTAYALLEDLAEAEAVTRDALAVAYGRRVRLAQEESPLEWVRAQVVRRARRRQRWRALPYRPPATDGAAEAIRLHRLAGLPPATIASIVDRPVETIEAEVGGAGAVSWVSVRQPVVRWVHDRAGQRTARRRMLAVAAVAVVVLAVAVPLLRVGQAATPPAAPPPSTAWTPPPAPGQRFVFDVQFADENHAFALRANCPSSDCDLELLASDDGRSWTSRPVRKPAVAVSMMGGLIVLGPEEVAVDWYPVSPPGDETYRVHTSDGGQTWRPVSTEPRRTLSEIPPGAALVPACFGGADPCTEAEPSVVLPGTGESARLASAPPLRQSYPGPMPLAGNQWWIVGIEPRTRKWAVAVSDDDGRSWTVSPLMAPREDLSDSWAVVGYGDDLYAYDKAETGGDYAMIAIFHSGDGGATWRRTRGRAPLRTMDSLVAAADGTLLTTSSAGRTLVSRDHGHTFTETAKRYHGFAYWAGAGYVSASRPEQQIMFSRDGLSWDRLHLSS